MMQGLGDETVRELRRLPLDLQHARCKNVIDEPLSLLLPNRGITQQSSGNEHLVCGLQHPLQVRRITLRQRKLFGEA